MVRNRVFLMGVGLGIIIGALLFQLMLSGNQSKEDLKELDALNGQRVYTQEEVDAILEEATRASDAAASAQTGESMEPTVKPVATPEPSPSLSPTEQVEPSATPTTTNTTAFVIRIKPGLNLTDTSALLAERRVIASASSFIRQMNSEKKSVRAGYFLFKENMTEAEAIRVVTSQPLTLEQAELIAGGPIE